jgi:mannosyltransferase OCH1-like enzyme
MWGRRLRQLLNLLLLALCVVVAYRYINARVGCLLSNEWKSHVVDVRSALLPEELTRPWDSEFVFVPPLKQPDPPNSADNGQIPLDKVEHPIESSQIPRILHQTYKTKDIPAKWSRPHEMCQNALVNYTYMLWTDESAREFIRTQYRWFLPTFDSYPYPIQRGELIL